MEEIERLFAGRRRSTRTDCKRPIDVVGLAPSYRGRTLNISRIGALFEISDEAFFPPGNSGSLLEAAEVARTVFPESMSIRFWHANVSVTAKIVRVAMHPTGQSAVFGCEFEKPLTRRQCQAIGIAPDVVSKAETAVKVDRVRTAR